MWDTNRQNWSVVGAKCQWHVNDFSVSIRTLLFLPGNSWEKESPQYKNIIAKYRWTATRIRRGGDGGGGGLPCQSLWFEIGHPYLCCGSRWPKCLTSALLWPLTQVQIQCCLMSTETIRIIRDGSLGLPPRLSRSSWALTVDPKWLSSMSL